VTEKYSVLEMNPGLKDKLRPAHHPSQRRPRDAAVLALIDRSGAAPKVLLGRRHSNHVFMPGLYVFPGGKVEIADARVPAIGALPSHVERRLQEQVLRGSPQRARAYALAAVRELSEETGLLLGKKNAAPDKLNGEWKTFGEHSVAPCLSDLHFIARAITPPGIARRYDTRFFAADISGVCHSIAGVIHGEAELVDLQWIPIAETGELNIHKITQIVLRELGNRLERGLEADLPVPFFRPRNGYLHRLEI
jgi:8-oxo-dGTP pyrophosphatase MutT (NUDIX family)